MIPLTFPAFPDVPCSVPQSSQTESLGFPSYPLPLNTPLKNPTMFFPFSPWHIMLYIYKNKSIQNRPVKQPSPELIPAFCKQQILMKPPYVITLIPFQLQSKAPDITLGWRCLLLCPATFCMDRWKQLILSWEIGAGGGQGAGGDSFS